MLGSEYVIPRLSKHFASLPSCANATSNSSLCTGSPPYSFLGRLLASFLDSRDAVAPASAQLTVLKSALFNDLSQFSLIITLLLFWILIPPCIQFFAGVSACRRRRNSKAHPTSRCLEITFILFFICWLCFHGILLARLVYSSSHADSGPPSLSRNSSQSLNARTFIDRVNALGVESFRLANSTVEKSKVTINELVLGLKSDLSQTAFGEIGEITDQFLKYTDLERALAMLLDLAQMLVSRLERGLHDRTSGTRTFFEEFRLESSLGLFNMLGLLPFNVSEVLAQLHGAAQMRTELEASLRQKTQNLFASLPLPQNRNDTTWLNPYFSGKFSVDAASPRQTCRESAEVVLSSTVTAAMAAVTSETEEESSASESGLLDVKQNSVERMKLLSKSESSISGSVMQIVLPIAREEPDCLKLLPSVQVVSSGLTLIIRL
ncbi:unnamed protein product [Dibothriocephalus latus]|uniref:Uncharacterized protein n=1 Tax=Dibothriocephalus latus TaxID=60516 RepID=A0A3P7LZM7_DIBLA|nr:unnamed protein product [Dibothriocephalus latus]